MAHSVPPHRTAAATTPIDDARIWEPCPTCWGQRRILHPTRNGEGLVPRLCTACLGIGERLVAPR